MERLIYQSLQRGVDKAKSRIEAFTAQLIQICQFLSLCVSRLADRRSIQPRGVEHIFVVGEITTHRIQGQRPSRQLIWPEFSSARAGGSFRLCRPLQDRTHPREAGEKKEKQEIKANQLDPLAVKC